MRREQQQQCRCLPVGLGLRLSVPHTSDEPAAARPLGVSSVLGSAENKNHQQKGIKKKRAHFVFIPFLSGPTLEVITAELIRRRVFLLLACAQIFCFFFRAAAVLRAFVLTLLNGTAVDRIVMLSTLARGSFDGTLPAWRWEAPPWSFSIAILFTFRPSASSVYQLRCVL